MIDLHLHLDGSLSPEDITYIASLTDTPLPTSDPDELRALLCAPADCPDLADYLRRFELPLSVLQTSEAIEEAVVRLMNRLSAEGLCYAEIRFAPQLHTRRGLTQQQVVEAALAGLARGHATGGTTARLILCCMRENGNGPVNRYTARLSDRYRDKGVCAVDLAGNEAAYPTESFSELFNYPDEVGTITPIMHAGEASGHESVRAALNLGARRIGHGIRAIDDPVLVKTLADRGIPLELCYSSNLQTKAVRRPEDYPLVQFMEAGVRVTLNTDNTAVSDTTLLREYRLVQTQFGLSDNQMESIAHNAADAAFLPENEKQRMHRRIEKEFAAWLRQS